MSSCSGKLKKSRDAAPLLVFEVGCCVYTENNGGGGGGGSSRLLSESTFRLRRYQVQCSYKRCIFIFAIVSFFLFVEEANLLIGVVSMDCVEIYDKCLPIYPQ